MIQRFFVMIFLLVLTTLTACVTDYQLVEKTQYVYVGIPKTLTDHIVPPAPPTNYVEVTGKTELEREQKRNKIMVDYSAVLIGVSIKSNQRLDSISSQDDKNRALIDDLNAKEEARVKQLVGNKIKDLKNEN